MTFTNYKHSNIHIHQHTNKIKSERQRNDYKEKKEYTKKNSKFYLSFILSKTEHKMVI